MSTLVAQTISNGTISTSTANVINGAKAWVQFAGATGAINGSYNISSITRNGTGDYTANFTIAMPNANYVAVGNSGINSITTAYTIIFPNATPASPFHQAPTTTACRFLAAFGTSSANATDGLLVNFAVFSS